MDFKNVIIMTDLDGTLLDDKKNISPRDMDSINEFCDKGGMFSIATGRGYSMAKPIADKLSLRIPAVIFNGSAVYDFTAEEFLWQCEVTQKAREYVKAVMDKFPDVGIEVLHKHTVYVPALNDVEKAHMALENVKGDICSLDDIPKEGWLKVLFAYPEDKMPLFARFIDENCYLVPNKRSYELSIMTGRGCPFHCAFCHEGHHTKKVRFRSVENVLEEIEIPTISLSSLPIESL